MGRSALYYKAPQSVCCSGRQVKSMTFYVLVRYQDGQVVCSRWNNVGSVFELRKELEYSRARHPDVRYKAIPASCVKNVFRTLDFSIKDWPLFWNGKE